MSTSKLERLKPFWMRNGGQDRETDHTPLDEGQRGGRRLGRGRKGSRADSARPPDADDEHTKFRGLSAQACPQLGDSYLTSSPGQRSESSIGLSVLHFATEESLEETSSLARGSVDEGGVVRPSVVTDVDDTGIASESGQPNPHAESYRQLSSLESPEKHRIKDDSEGRKARSESGEGKVDPAEAQGFGPLSGWQGPDGIMFPDLQRSSSPTRQSGSRTYLNLNDEYEGREGERYALSRRKQLPHKPVRSESQYAHMVQSLQDMSRERDAATRDRDAARRDVERERKKIEASYRVVADQDEKLDRQRRQIDDKDRKLNEQSFRLNALNNELKRLEGVETENLRHRIELAARDRQTTQMNAKHANELELQRSELNQLHEHRETKLAEEVQALTQRCNKMHKEHLAEVAGLKDDNKGLKTSHARELKNLGEEKDKLLQDQSQAWTERWNKMLADHRKEVDGLKSEINDLQQQYDKELEELDAERDKTLRDHKEKVAKLNLSIKETQTSHAEEMTALKKAHDDRLASIKTKLKEREHKLEIKHQQNTKNLRASVRDLNDALLASDNDKYHGSVFTIPDLPQSPDGQIQDRFVEVQQLVEELGRLTWKKERTMWPERLIPTEESKTGSRLARKAIVQDMAWTLLFRSIFCSPFRVFGEEGLKLEKEWVEQCGKGETSRTRIQCDSIEAEVVADRQHVDPTGGEQLYGWPAPGVKAERWRYMTMSQCREILAKPKPSEFDKRARITDGFKSSVNRLVTELKAAIGSVAELTAAEVQLIQRLSTTASRVWFEFCMYRCRIVVRLAGSELMQVVEKPNAAQKSKVKLTVLPEVGRYGNVKGVELETFTTICAGDSITLPD